MLKVRKKRLATGLLPSLPFYPFLTAFANPMNAPLILILLLLACLACGPHATAQGPLRQKMGPDVGGEDNYSCRQLRIWSI